MHLRSANKRKLILHKQNTKPHTSKTLNPNKLVASHKRSSSKATRALGCASLLNATQQIVKKIVLVIWFVSQVTLRKSPSKPFKVNKDAQHSSGRLKKLLIKLFCYDTELISFFILSTQNLYVVGVVFAQRLLRLHDVLTEQVFYHVNVKRRVSPQKNAKYGVTFGRAGRNGYRGSFL